MAELLLGIDVGTSAVKAGVFAADGRLLGIGRSACPVSNPRPGWAECDPERWWRSLQEALAAACVEADCNPADIAAIGTGVLFPCIAPLDAGGNPLHAALLYCDQRSLAQVRAIEAKAGRAEFEARIGNRLVPGTCAVTSLAWLRDERPDAYAGARAMGFANTFLNARLTGELAADPSHAALSGLIDISDPWQWDKGLCDLLGIDPHLLPRIAGSAEVMGGVTRQAADATGLGSGTPVVAGAGDVIVSAVGGGTASSRTIVYIVGSTDCVALPCTAPPADGAWASSAYVPRDMWLGIGTTTSSGVSVEWFCREVLGAGGSGAVDEMTRLAEQSPPGSNGLLFLPYLQGERTPVWDPEARGVFVGITSSTTRADLARSVLEGTAFAFAEILATAPRVARDEVAEIRAVGGGTRNRLWNQIKADTTGRPIEILDFQETGTLGAALLAGLGAGVYSSFDEAVGVARSVTSVAVVTPRPEMTRAYAETVELYGRVYRETAGIAHGLARMG
jgi:xylulokinase